MHDLARIDSINNPGIASDAAAQCLALGLVCTAEEIEQILRLRYEVFTEEMGVVFPDAHDGMEQDCFDPWCEYLMVQELDTGRLVGTYRILTPARACQAGGYYSQSEFDLSGLGEIVNEIVEVGRSCTHSDYRNGAVIMLLWSGLTEYLRRGAHDYVLGCASVSLRDGAAAAAEVWRSMSSHLMDTSIPKVTPLHRYPVERLDTALPAKVPPLIKGYLKLGAKIYGEPACDPDFNVADFPVLMNMSNMDLRYRRHFGQPRRASV